MSGARALMEDGVGRDAPVTGRDLQQDCLGDAPILSAVAGVAVGRRVPREDQTKLAPGHVSARRGRVVRQRDIS